MPFSFENAVGRLLAVRIESGMTLEEAQHFRTRMYLWLTSLPGRGVLVGDLIHAERFSPAVNDKMLEMLKTDNPKVERTAFIMSGGLFATQVEHLVLRAQQAAVELKRPAPMRRVFRDKLAARNWLGEVLTADERAQLAEWIDGIRH
jgi:hypothetical protein